jgi:hypothetical protein
MNQSFNWKKDKKAGFYVMAGAKALFLVNYNYTSEIALLNNAAYYPEFDNWIYEQPAFRLGVFDGNSASEKLKFSILAMLAFETGAKWRIGRNAFLYTGVYFDWGLHEPTKKYREPYKNYYYPEHLNDLPLLSFADRKNLISVGIKLRLAFFRSLRLDTCPYR